MTLDAARLRQDFPLLHPALDGTRLVYLDSAATSQKPRAVLDAIRHYYSLVPRDTGDAWSLMTADYQTNHAGGRASYDAFWAPVTAVSATDVRAIGTDRVEATITYHRHGGTTVEDTTFVLVPEGGVLKIADSSVVSSTG